MPSTFVPPYFACSIENDGQVVQGFSTRVTSMQRNVEALDHLNVKLDLMCLKYVDLQNHCTSASISTGDLLGWSI